ncbi:MAG: glycosyltransferase [Crocinitomicaceae bacterium]|nr:glycosyltransferase [Crocinitomicaceae bacterium]
MKLTILLFCYNLEMLIEQAIESVLNQKTDFEFQLVVADDGSTDNTMNIVNDYAKIFPTTILPLTSSKVDFFENVYRTENAIKCEYIALLDRDDFGNLKENYNSRLIF